MWTDKAYEDKFFQQVREYFGFLLERDYRIVSEQTAPVHNAARVIFESPVAVITVGREDWGAMVYIWLRSQSRGFALDVFIEYLSGEEYDTWKLFRSEEDPFAFPKTAEEGRALVEKWLKWGGEELKRWLGEIEAVEKQGVSEEAEAGLKAVENQQGDRFWRWLETRRS